MMTRPGFLFSLALAFAVTTSGAVAADTERINSYHSDIEVLKDGSLKVSETIKVTARHQKIKRGIYRDFPTVYKTKYFVTTEVPFDVASVTRDGQVEPFHTERRSNGVRVYIGSEDRQVPTGEHTYQIVYTTNYQLGYFNTFDELYWNVTGNGWDFPIDEATAAVKLPADVPLGKVKHEGYTGPAGSKARNLVSSIDEAAGTVDFATTRPLARHEGLTIVVEFPKGYVHEPTEAERRAMFFQSNLTLWVMLGGLFVVLAYHVAAWVAVGRDPPGDVIIPQFEPPLNLAPACARYLRRMGYDRKCFTAAVIDMAVKGQVTIEEEDGKYSLVRNGAARQANLSAGEQAVITTLLSSGSKSIEFKQTNHVKIKKAIGKLGEWLSKEFDGRLFVKNRRWLVPGWLIAAAAVAAVALSSGWQGLPIVGFMSIWLSVWTVVCMVLAVTVGAAWRSAWALRRGTMKRLGSYGGAFFITAFAVPFFFGEVAGIGMLASGTSIWIVPMLVGVVAIAWSFWYLIKQPTVEGRRVMDQIEGFRMYMGTAEKEYLDKLNPPEHTPELFEKYLPYALALDVENQWSEKFSEVLARAATDSGDGYQPSWYRGSGWQAASAGAFASGLGSSLGSAISSSSTAPGSSSGGGGGGSSGGGGGGGGGGGW
jgi:uncharacterized membrane protein YgcG